MNILRLFVQTCFLNMLNAMNILRLFVQTCFLNMLNYSVGLKFSEMLSSEFWKLMLIDENTIEFRCLQVLLLFQCITPLIGIASALSRSLKWLRLYSCFLAFGLVSGVVFLARWTTVAEKTITQLDVHMEKVATDMVMGNQDGICEFWYRVQNKFRCYTPKIVVDHCYHSEGTLLNHFHHLTADCAHSFMNYVDEITRKFVIPYSLSVVITVLMICEVIDFLHFHTVSYTR